MIKSPRGVVVVNDNSRSFYVCSNDTNSIVNISFDGVILSNHKLTDMNMPYSIAISADNDKLTDMDLPYFIAISVDNSALVVSNNCKGHKKVMLFEHTKAVGDDPATGF